MIVWNEMTMQKINFMQSMIVSRRWIIFLYHMVSL